MKKNIFIFLRWFQYVAKCTQPRHGSQFGHDGQRQWSSVVRRTARLPNESPATGSHFTTQLLQCLAACGARGSKTGASGVLQQQSGQQRHLRGSLDLRIGVRRGRSLQQECRQTQDPSEWRSAATAWKSDGWRSPEKCLGWGERSHTSWRSFERGFRRSRSSSAVFQPKIFRKYYCYYGALTWIFFFFFFSRFLCLKTQIFKGDLKWHDVFMILEVVGSTKRKSWMVFYLF